MLLTEYAYTPAGWVGSVTDPRGLVTQTSYDGLGRVTQTVDDFTGDGTPTNSSNVMTDYAYDGDGHVVSQTAMLPGGVTQVTASGYGVTGLINSNDLLGSVTHPDNGQPHTESYSYAVVSRKIRHL